MSIISLVYAVSLNGVIGKAGGLPWHIPSDLKHFKEVTMGKPVIMGRRTWESLPRKPLPGRPNIVISRSGFSAEGADVAASVMEAVRRAQTFQASEICVIGGAEMFKCFLPLAQRIHLTRVLADTAGDTFMPQIAPQEWQEVAHGKALQGERDSHPFETVTLERRPE